MILSNDLTDEEIAKTIPCSTRSIVAIRSNLRRHGSARAPRKVAGWPRTMSTPMLHALCDHLVMKPELYLDEMAMFLYDEFRISVPEQTIGRALASAGWTKKTARRVAQQRNADLRDYYQYKLSEFRSYQLVYVDESGCDGRVGLRRTGWSPQGLTLIQVTRLHRGRRYQILPAYTQDGILFSRVLQGSIDGAIFEEFVEQL